MQYSSKHKNITAHDKRLQNIDRLTGGESHQYSAGHCRIKHDITQQYSTLQNKTLHNKKETVLTISQAVKMDIWLVAGATRHNMTE